MAQTSFSFSAVAEEDYAFGHSQDGQPNKFGLRATLSSSTLHTTAGDLGRFGAYLANHFAKDSVEENLGYVLLTNSANGPTMVRALEERVFGRRLGR